MSKINKKYFKNKSNMVNVKSSLLCFKETMWENDFNSNQEEKQVTPKSKEIVKSPGRGAKMIQV